MRDTAPAWLEITALATWIVGAAAYVAWAALLWIVRLRFPLSDVDPRLVARADEDLVLQLTAPVQRVVREAVVPSAHQPAARRPAWRVPVGPWFPDATAVTFRMPAQVGAARVEDLRLPARGSVPRDADGARRSPGRTSAP